MALVRCPKCGHQVLSVASRCPSCSEQLTPDPTSVGGLNELEPCPRCEGLMVRWSRSCPHCGYAASRWRALRAAGAVGLVAIAVGLFFLVVPMLDSEPEQPSPLMIPIPEEPEAPVVVATPPIVAGDDRSQLPPREPMTIAAPQGARRAGLLQRWTKEWANVRGRRDRAAPVVLVVPPGTEVNVGSFAGGWWAVFAADTVIGYMAGDLVDSTAPDSIPRR